MSRMLTAIALIVILGVLLACAPPETMVERSRRISVECVRVTSGYPRVYRCLDREAGVVLWYKEDGLVVLPIEETNLR